MAHGRFTVSILRRWNDRGRITHVGGAGMSGAYAPAIEFTLLAHNVVTGEHAETGAVVASLNTGCEFWGNFPASHSEPFSFELMPFRINLEEVVYNDDYVHAQFHITDGNHYAVTPKLDVAVYVGDEFTNVISYVQWNQVVRTVAQKNDAYMFGIRARKQIKRAITREYTGMHLVRK